MVIDQIMVDIETLGVDPGCPILSIAAVKFDLDTGETGDTFYKKIDLKSYTNSSFVINYETLAWWLQQDPEALRETQIDCHPLNEVLDEFRRFVEGDYFLWGNSARFDLGILEMAYKICRQKTPWKFRNERDVRTLLSFSPEVKENWLFTGIAHNPLHDCLNQIGQCCEVWKKLTLKNTENLNLTPEEV